MSDYILPKIYKTKGKNPKLFIKVNGKKKYIKLENPNMTESEIVNFIFKNYKIRRRKPKTSKKSSKRVRIIKNDKVEKAPLQPQPKSLGAPYQTTKQDIPEISNLLGELRTYKATSTKAEQEARKALSAKALAEAETLQIRSELRRNIQDRDLTKKQADAASDKLKKTNKRILDIVSDSLSKANNEYDTMKSRVEENRIKTFQFGRNQARGISSLRSFAKSKGINIPVKRGTNEAFVIGKLKETIDPATGRPYLEEITKPDTIELEQSVSSLREIRDKIQAEYDQTKDQYDRDVLDLEDVPPPPPEELHPDDEEQDKGYDPGDRKGNDDMGLGLGGTGRVQDLESLKQERERLLHLLRKRKDLYGSGGLWTNQINSIMKKVPNFLGTVASDQFEEIASKIKPDSKAGWISNLDPSTKGGSHWVSFVINGTDENPDAHSIMYFDPFGEDIPQNMLTGLKQIADKVAPDTLLKLKINRVQHQDKRTENCGYFAMNFILDILSRKKSFTEASGFKDRIEDRSGRYEKEIEKLKSKIPFRYLDSVDVQEGGKIRSVAPPKVRDFLQKYGDDNIESIGVYRKPILSVIQKGIDWIRKLTGSEAKAEYDKLFHLYLVIRLTKSDQTFKLERNQVLNLVKASQDDLSGKNVEARAVAIPKMSFGEMFKKAEGGNPSFYRYSAINNNCQDFVLAMLRAGGVLTSNLQTFIKQDVSQLLPRFVSKIADKVTDVAHEVDVVMEGEGCGCPYQKQSRRIKKSR